MSVEETFDKSYMFRCIELGSKALGNVSPNPLVGAVLLHNNKIIGEGYHQKFGQPHAEVNAIQNAIANGFEHLLRESDLYVNLEPCSHHGKTPPCTDLIISHNIKRVIVGCRDPFPEVNGRGIAKLRNAGIEVVEDILRDECMELNKRFITFQTKKRPYIILKYAQSLDGFISPIPGDDKKVSNEFTDMVVHKWRSEEDGILVGTTTALEDDPMLTVRKWKGRNPVRIVVDKSLRLPSTLRLFNSEAPTIVINGLRHGADGNIEWINIDFNSDVPQQILQALYERKIQSLIIEGGRNILTQFISSNLWDEARIITSGKIFKNGTPSPSIRGKEISKLNLHGDEILLLTPTINS